MAFNYAGAPTLGSMMGTKMPGTQGMIDTFLPQGSYNSALAAGGELKDPYRLNIGEGIAPASKLNGQNYMLDTGAYQADQGALNAMKSRAMAQGPSPWLNMQLDKQAQEQTQLQNLGALQSRSSTNQAMGDLAMRGGLSSGARERLARGGAQDLRTGYQDTAFAGAGRRADLNIADDQQKMAMLAQIPGMDLQFADQKAGLQQYNLGQLRASDEFNAMSQFEASRLNKANELQAALANQQASLGGLGDANAWNMNRADLGMKGYASEQMGKALGGGGGGGGDPNSTRLDNGGWHNIGTYGNMVGNLTNPLKKIPGQMGRVGLNNPGGY